MPTDSAELGRRPDVTPVRLVTCQHPERSLERFLSKIAIISRNIFGERRGRECGAPRSDEWAPFAAHGQAANTCATTRRIGTRAPPADRPPAPHDHCGQHAGADQYRKELWSVPPRLADDYARHAPHEGDPGPVSVPRALVASDAPNLRSDARERGREVEGAVRLIDGDVGQVGDADVKAHGMGAPHRPAWVPHRHARRRLDRRTTRTASV
jgi:hypothetical protein